jgi:D-galactarolactone cycloisomerase
MTRDLAIRRVRVHRLAAPLRERFGWSLGWARERGATLVEVETEGGLKGWGDGTFGGDVLLRRPELVIGKTPFEHEAIFESLREPSMLQARRGEARCGGLDCALWDLMGKVLGAPAHRLLGPQYRDRVRPYCTAMYRKDWEDWEKGLAEEAVGWKSKGFRVLKMKIGFGVEQDVRLVRAVREAIGQETGLAVDSNCAYDLPAALRLGAKLEEFGLLWWEEPLLASDLEGYTKLGERVRIPLASCETVLTDGVIRDWVGPRRVSIVQPEIEFVGLTGGRRISQACWLHGVQLVPHNWGTAVRTAAILQWMAAMPPLTEGIYHRDVTFELDCTESAFRDVVIREGLAMDTEGRMLVWDKPGLGVEVVEEAVAEYRRELITME